MAEPLTFKRRPVVVHAMQTAPSDPMMAAKDREEHNRQVAAWIINNDGDLRSFTPDTIELGTSMGVKRTNPGSWVIRGTNGKFYLAGEENFGEMYEPTSD